MRKRAFLIVAVMALAAAGAVAATSGGSAAAARSAARADAARLLARLQLPPGAKRVTKVPGGGGGWLAKPFSWPATPNLVDHHQWWVIDRSVGATSGYIRAHKPTGSKLSLRGGASGTGTAVSALGYSWPSITGVLASRQVIIELVALPGHRTGLRVDAQVVWITPRPASERIPTSVNRLRVTVRRANAVRQGPLTFMSRSKIEKVVAVLNELPRAQPGARACPADPGVFVTLRFYVAGAARPTAVALIDPYGCGGVTLTLNGRRRPALASGPIPGESAGTSLIDVLQRDLGIRLRVGI